MEIYLLVAVLVSQAAVGVSLYAIARFLGRIYDSIESVRARQAALLQSTLPPMPAPTAALTLEDVATRKMLMATVDEFVDEGIALAEAAGRNSVRFGAGKLTALDKRREAVAHAASRARLAGVSTTDSELAKLVEVRLTRAQHKEAQP